MSKLRQNLLAGQHVDTPSRDAALLPVCQNAHPPQRSIFLRGTWMLPVELPGLFRSAAKFGGLRELSRTVSERVGDCYSTCLKNVIAADIFVFRPGTVRYRTYLSPSAGNALWCSSTCLVAFLGHFPESPLETICRSRLYSPDLLHHCGTCDVAAAIPLLSAPAATGETSAAGLSADCQLSALLSRASVSLRSHAGIPDIGYVLPDSEDCRTADGHVHCVCLGDDKLHNNSAELCGDDVCRLRGCRESVH